MQISSDFIRFHREISWEPWFYRMLTWAAPQIVRSTAREVALWNVAMSQARSRWPLALALLLAMPQRRLEADRVSFNIAISACAQGSRWRAALQLLSCLPPDLIGLSSAVNSCTRARKLHHALSLVGDSQVRRLGVDTILLGSVLGMCERAFLWQEALQLLKPRHELSLTCYLPALGACGKATQWEMALELFEKLRDHLQPDVLSWAALLEAQRRASQWRRCLQPWRPQAQRAAAEAAQAWPSRAPRWRFGPDAAAVHRLAELCDGLRAEGSVATQRALARRLLGPVVRDARARPPEPNALSLATTGLGGAEREAAVLLKLQPWAPGEKESHRKTCHIILYHLIYLL